MKNLGKRMKFLEETNEILLKENIKENGLK